MTIDILMKSFFCFWIVCIAKILANFFSNLLFLSVIAFLFQIIMSENANNLAPGEYRFQAIDKKFESLDGKQNRDHLIKW
jgi:hypothetical protein